jgi:hypothetical protein
MSHNYEGPLYSPHPDIMIDFDLYRLAVWNNTAHGHTLWPMDRTDINLVQSKVTEYMHSVMHRPTEVQDDQW